jgi:hypothetical protein
MGGVMIGTQDEEGHAGTSAGGRAACTTTTRSVRWRRIALVGGGVALLAGAAYAAGWIGETGLLWAAAAVVLSLRATLGGFG